MFMISLILDAKGAFRDVFSAGEDVVLLFFTTSAKLIFFFT